MPVGEDLEIRSVRLGAHDRALVGIGPPLAALVGDVETDVPDLPIEPAVRPHRQAGDPVTAKRRVHAVALADDDLAIDGAVAVVVLQPPDAGRRSDQQVAAVVEQAAGDVVGRIGVEALDHDLRRVGQPVAVRILDAIEPFLELGEVAKIVRAVLIEVRQPLILRAALRRQLLAVELAKVADGLQRVDRRHPRRMLADVERHVVAARARRVERAALVELERHGIDDERVRRPELELESAGISTVTPLRASAASRVASAGVSLTLRGSGLTAADWPAAPRQRAGDGHAKHDGEQAESGVWSALV